jgi:dihydroxyacid dehydratase/phosphogluconate dehydratase
MRVAETHRHRRGADGEEPPHHRQDPHEKAFENAMRVLLAIGGSTNAIVHLTAIAGRWVSTST